MTDIMTISKNGETFYPQTHYKAVLGLKDYIASLIPDPADVSTFIDQSSMSKYVLEQLKSYALSKDIPDVSTFITKAALAPYALSKDVPSLDGYAKLTDIPKIDLTSYATVAQLDALKSDPTMRGPQGIKGDTGPVGPAGTDGVILDTDRTTNWTPAQCLANWPAQTVRHFKITSSLGITMPSGYTSSYCVLTTKVPGVNAGYGGPIQIAEPTDAKRPFTFKRVGISTTAWSAWELVTTW